MRTIAAISLSLAIAVPVAAQPVMYSVRDLGIRSTNQIAINNSGQTAGFTTGRAVFRGSADGQITYIGTGVGFGINSSGQVAATSDTAYPGGHGVLTTANGDFSTATDLGPSGGNSDAYAVNDVGQVAGRAQFPGNPGYHAVRTAPGGVFDGSADLGTLPGGTVSSARAINAAGQVTGTARVLGDTATHAYRTTATGTLNTAADLGTLGSGPTSIGYAINASGQIAGVSFTASNAERAFRSSPNGQPISLQDLGPGQAFGINAMGVVVGYTDLPNGSIAGFIFDTQFHNLNSLVPAGWNIADAYAINDSGQIAADGSFQGGSLEYLVLTPTPVPEPSALALTGLAGVWLVRRILISRSPRSAPLNAPTD